jgi:hypothetical protein
VTACPRPLPGCRDAAAPGPRCKPPRSRAACRLAHHRTLYSLRPCRRRDPRPQAAAARGPRASAWNPLPLPLCLPPLRRPQHLTPSRTGSATACQPPASHLMCAPRPAPAGGQGPPMRRQTAPDGRLASSRGCGSPLLDRTNRPAEPAPRRATLAASPPTLCFLRRPPACLPRPPLETLERSARRAAPPRRPPLPAPRAPLLGSAASGMRSLLEGPPAGRPRCKGVETGAARSVKARSKRGRKRRGAGRGVWGRGRRRARGPC